MTRRLLVMHEQPSTSALGAGLPEDVLHGADAMRVHGYDAPDSCWSPLHPAELALTYRRTIDLCEQLAAEPVGKSHDRRRVAESIAAPAHHRRLRAPAVSALSEQRRSAAWLLKPLRWRIVR